MVGKIVWVDDLLADVIKNLASIDRMSYSQEVEKLLRLGLENLEYLNSK